MKVVVLTTSYPRHADDVAGHFVRDAVESVRAAGVDVELGRHDLERVARAGLVVVGSGAGGSVRRLLFGSVSRAVVNRAACAVASAPGGMSRPPVRRWARSAGTASSGPAMPATAWCRSTNSRSGSPTR